MSSVDPVTLLGTEIDKQLTFEKHASTISPFYIFLWKQYSILYIVYYICILQMFLNISLFYSRLKKVIYIIILWTVFIRSSPSFFELTYMVLQNNCINNCVTNGFKYKKAKKACKQL